MCKSNKCEFKPTGGGKCSFKGKDDGGQDVDCSGLEEGLCKKEPKCRNNEGGCEDAPDCESFLNKTDCKSNMCRFSSIGSCSAKVKLVCAELSTEDCKKRKKECTLNDSNKCEDKVKPACGDLDSVKKCNYFKGKCTFNTDKEVCEDKVVME